MKPDFRPTQWTSYQRQIQVWGEEFQWRLSQARVMVIGLGGLGVPTCIQLLSSGLRSLIINDFDVIELSNLARQYLYTSADIMKAKAPVLAKRLSSIYSDSAEVEVVDGLLSESELVDYFARVDAVLDCTDNFESRYAINRAACAAKVALISAGATGSAGQVSCLDLRAPTAPCYQCLFPNLDDEETDCNQAGVLNPILGIISCIQAYETMCILNRETPSATGHLYRYDMQKQSFNHTLFQQDPACTVCGSGT